MAVIIQARHFSSGKQDGILKPIIYCCAYGDVENKAVPINVKIAEKLLQFNQNRRARQMEKCFTQVLSELPDGVIIKDFDVMFNPNYQVDVLMIMVTTCKRKPFSVVWPGTFNDGKLFYAEEGYPDYKVFSINQYDVTCIV